MIIDVYAAQSHIMALKLLILLSQQIGTQSLYSLQMFWQTNAFFIGIEERVNKWSNGKWKIMRVQGLPLKGKRRCEDWRRKNRRFKKKTKCIF